MGRKKTAKPTKSDKASPAVQQEQQAGHPCPDWAAMQAYYGPGVTMPPPYFNATVPPGQMPPYMWGPQMMPPFAPPYPGIYPHGGVYSHPALPPGSAYPTTSEAVAATTTISTGAKSSNSKKKLKGSDGLAVPTGSGNTENTDGETDGSQSEENGEEDSSDESDWNSEPGGNKTNKKRGSGDAQTSGLTGKAVGKMLIPRTDSQVVTRSSTMRASNAATPPPATALEMREARREKRMRSNRESARRSRMKKQAAIEAVAQTAKNLEVENMNLKSEIAQLKENSERLRMENSCLMEKLKDPQLGQPEELIPGRTDIESDPSAVVENFLSRIDDSISTMMGQKDDPHHENTMLHQLLDSSPRTDAVAAS